jgi:hypothetical protein
MSMTPTSSGMQVAETRRSLAMNGEYISVGEALKLIPPFKGSKSEVLAFIGNVDTAFSVINPNQEHTLYKFVLIHIFGEP